MRTPLTWERMNDALYCCSPAGLAVLNEHLRSRGVEFEAHDIQRVLGDAVSRGAVITRAIPFGNVPGGVQLFALPGHGL